MNKNYDDPQLENKIKKLEECFLWISEQHCDLCDKQAVGMGNGVVYCEKHFTEKWWEQENE